MKKLLLFASVFLLAACGGSGSRKLSATGGPYEVVVVAADKDWKSAGLGDSIRSVLRAAVPYINSYEPQFDVYNILPDRFVDVLRRNGNVLIVQLDAKHTTPRFAVQYDQFSEPQAVVYALAADAASLAKYLGEHGGELRGIYNDSERGRWLTSAFESPDVALQGKVHEKFGIGISLHSGFIEAKDAEDFMWMRFRYPEADQELSIFTYPADGEPTLEGLMDARDRFVSLIPGETPDSHMVTVRELEPHLSEVVIDGRRWIEMRGLWEVENDYMGGAFVSYSTVVDGRVLTIDGAVYSPSPYKMKRNLLRQLESVVYSVKI